jgi:hypothetical protein
MFFKPLTDEQTHALRHRQGRKHGALDPNVPAVVCVRTYQKLGYCYIDCADDLGKSIYSWTVQCFLDAIKLRTLGATVDD